MNVLMRVQAPTDAVKIAHSVMAYDRATEDLDVELPIPLFLDTLAVKIARVPPEDKYGALSYELDARAVETFRFLLGLDVDMSRRDYFFEPAAGHVTGFSHQKLKAMERLTEVTPRPRYARTARPRISERELVVPILRVLFDGDRGWMATSDVIARLAELFAPSGQGAGTLVGRGDAAFSRTVRHMIANRDHPSSFIRKGLAHYERHGLRISDEGHATVRALLS